MLRRIQTVPPPKALKPTTQNIVCDTSETCGGAAALREAKVKEIPRYYCFRMV